MSDHFSGPRALAGPLCDICDVYAFPSPEREGQLVLVMDLLPNAPADALFSDAIVCRFRLRPLAIHATGPDASFAVGTEATEINCDVNFDTPATNDRGAISQRGRLTSSTGSRVDFFVNDEAGSSAEGLRVFAGPRSDPFFLDFAALQKTLVTGKLAFTEPGSLEGPRGLGAGANVLSVVVEIDCARHLASIGPLFAFVGETLSEGKLPIRLERVGRPEIKNLLLGPKNHDQLNRDIELRDLYNLEDAFHLGPDYRNAYRVRMSANLAYFDSLDGKQDWQLDEQGTHPLTELLLADFLVCDISKPYSEASYFEIERAILEGREHTTCGARSLNENVMDTQYTLYVNAGKGPRITDHLTQSTVRAGLSFPYLAPANRKASAARGEDAYREKLQHHHH